MPRPLSGYVPCSPPSGWAIDNRGGVDGDEDGAWAEDEVQVGDGEDRSNFVSSGR
jgi:hypothetical protein